MPSWQITSFLESVQTDILESVHFHLIFNLFVFTSSNHFTILIEKQNQTGNSENNFCIKASTKLYTNYCHFDTPYSTNPYLKSLEFCSLLSAPNVLKNRNLQKMDFFFFFLQSFVRLEAFHIVRDKQCYKSWLKQQKSLKLWRYLISLIVLLILILIF